MTWFGRIAEVYGPTASILLVVLILVLFWYRRDFIIRHEHTKEERERMTVIVDRNALGMEKLAEAVGRLSETTREAGDRYTRQIEDLIHLTERYRAAGRGRPR